MSEGNLQCVFELAGGESSLRLSIDQNEFARFEFEFGAFGFELIGGPGLLALCDPRALFTELNLNLANAVELRVGGDLGGERRIDLRDHLGLDGKKLCGGLTTLGLGNRDRTFVAMENRQFEREPDRPLVLALIPVVAGTEVESWILPGDFEGEGREDIGERL